MKPLDMFSAFLVEHWVFTETFEFFFGVLVYCWQSRENEEGRR
jgi:hypothetical protein